jgi:hypothetical protein
MRGAAVRISRPCYDKFHRCPGWAGGGGRYAKVQRCDSGRVQVDYDAPLWKWRMWPCGTCPVVVLPYVIRWAEPRWWLYTLHSRASEIRYRLSIWRDDRRRNSGS